MIIKYLKKYLPFEYQNHSSDMSILANEDLHLRTNSSQMDMVILKIEEGSIDIDVIGGAGGTPGQLGVVVHIRARQLAMRRGQQAMVFVRKFFEKLHVRQQQPRRVVDAAGGGPARQRGLGRARWLAAPAAAGARCPWRAPSSTSRPTGSSRPSASSRRTTSWTARPSRPS